MISIKDRKVLIRGDIYELIDDLQALITLITIREVDSKHYERIDEKLNKLYREGE